MYQVLTNIIVQQIPSDSFPDRNLQVTIPFFHSYSGSSSWDDITSTMKIVIPKNVKLKFTNLQSGTYSLGSINQALGGGNSPTFLQGDMITFNVGYRTKLMGNGGNEITYMTGGTDPTGTIPDTIPPLFEGFITKVSPRLPFTIECEDAMWLLKQITTGKPNEYINSTIPDIVSGLLTSTQAQTFLGWYKDPSTGDPLFSLTISDYSQNRDLVFTMQSFWTHGESIAQMLTRLKTQYQVNSWFRGFELRTGLTCYIPDDAVVQNFTFTQNILDGDSIAFKRTDDNSESIIVKTTYSVPQTNDDGTNAQTADGQDIYNSASTEVFVYADNNGNFSEWDKTSSDPFPADNSGRRSNWHLYGVTGTGDNTIDVTSTADLQDIGIRLLKKNYYTGLYGSFSTFGVPYVKHGDVINLTHPLLPDMNGMYMCRHVTYQGSAEEGLRQTITIDFGIDSTDDIAAFS